MSARRSAALGLCLFLLLVGCGRAASPPAAEASLPPSYAADQLALRVEYVDGFVAPVSRATRLPIVSVYGDGRVITEGPVPAIYPGPALPNVLVRSIDPSDVRRLAARMVAAGVGQPLDVGQPGVADAPSTRFTVLTAGGKAVTSVNALNEESGVGLSATQRANRHRLSDLLAALTDLPRTLGAGAVGPQHTYVPTALAAVASAWTDPGAGLPVPPAKQWPGPPLPGASLGTGYQVGCVSMTGDAATAVLAAAASANAATPWLSGGQQWSVWLRPLLPDESSCTDLRPDQ